MSDSEARETKQKDIKDASTVIVLREADAGIETFMLCRHRKSGFMGGAHVFPGGKVDASDSEPSWEPRVDQSIEEITARLGEDVGALGLGLLIAAIRETFEEAGVLLAKAKEDADLEAMRERLHGGYPFSQIASDIEMTIDATTLTPYARWITPEIESHRFDTRFFIAAIPEGQHASHDGTETTSAVWLKPAQAIEDMHAGRIVLAPPTVRTIQWLAEFDDVQSVVADAASRKPPLVRPKVVTDETGWFLALPGDPAHTEKEAVLPGATRMIFDRGSWRDAPSGVR